MPEKVLRNLRSSHAGGAARASVGAAGIVVVVFISVAAWWPESEIRWQSKATIRITSYQHEHEHEHEYDYDYDYEHEHEHEHDYEHD
jgi:ABC-type nickel/cobalt efflux system permease component RcnA